MHEPVRSGLQAGTMPILPVTAERLFVQRNGRALLDVEKLTISGGGTTVLVGPNGAGKSLLLKVLAALHQADTGRVLWNGVPPDRQRYCRFGMVLQTPVLLRRSARANIEFALRAVGCNGSEARERAQSALEAARLLPLANASARVLSGGEMQCLALARALATEPDLLFLDEPTSSLDPASMQTIEAMVRSASKDGMRIVVIAHDLAQARRLGDEIIFMHRGKIVERAPTLPFFQSPGTEDARDFIAGKILV
ncbi:MAG: ATP-binding cassette domain-containing protein [Hyphomicrobiales bacterium]|nr:ATP-binding cassette domain-containing protein [Hyphomicrobiales bacterium]MCP5000853.1 ATP-binding cassette domain-containing protein [Hyphomicrobiales bacterium]